MDETCHPMVTDPSFARQRYDMTSVKQSQGFQNLSQQVQSLITSLSQGMKDFEGLRIVLIDAQKQTRDHINEALYQQQAQQRKERCREQFLASLWFTEINSREERIADAHRETFEWIFDESSQDVRPWDSFIQWLESDQNVYWINGKAGSGKSTLMSFLCHHPRTKISLRVWSRKRSLLMPRFFFWSGGTLLQKSIEGLLRSLIWQILNELPDLDVGFDQPIAAWTERRLRTTLRKLVQLALKSHTICFFIDGMDEFAADHDELVAFIRQAMQGTDVKVCLSSRPYRAFKEAFRSSAKLRLQDLTRNDIKKFLIDTFQGMEQASSSSVSEDPLWPEKVTLRISLRAEGIFLWVALAARDQMHGLRNGDSLTQLEERLDNLPNEIEGVYAHMLSQIEKCYQREASKLLQVALHAAQHDVDCTLLGLTLASHGQLNDIIASPGGIPEPDLLTISHSVRERIGITCAGLLEIRGEPEADDPTLERGGEDTIYQIFNLDSHVDVEFVHRTAIDFMQDQRQGGAFLKASSPPEFDPQVSYVKVSLAKLSLFGRRYDKHVIEIMSQMWDAENRVGVAQEYLCEFINDAMSNIDLTHPDWDPDSPWCTRWGSLSYDMHPNDPPTESESVLSSSREYFYSIVSHLGARPCRGMPGKEPAFMAYAALHGLFRYLLQVLISQKVLIVPGVANWILCCSHYEGRKHETKGIIASVLLTGECLRRGADPNLKVRLHTMLTCNYTVWSIFLETMLYYLHYHPQGHRFTLTEGDLAEFRTACLQTTLAFIECGVDLHTFVTLWVSAGDSTPRGFKGGPNEYAIRARRVYGFKVELSPVAIFEQCFNKLDEVTQIRNICATKGAGPYRKCLGMKVRTFIGIHIDNVRQYDLSGHESGTFIRLFERDLSTRAATEHFKYRCVQLGDEIYHDRLETIE